MSVAVETTLRVAVRVAVAVRMTARSGSVCDVAKVCEMERLAAVGSGDSESEWVGRERAAEAEAERPAKDEEAEEWLPLRVVEGPPNERDAVPVFVLICAAVAVAWRVTETVGGIDLDRVSGSFGDDTVKETVAERVAVVWHRQPLAEAAAPVPSTNPLTATKLRPRGASQCSRMWHSVR